MTTVVRVMKEEDFEQATHFLRDNFYRDEPLLQTPGDHRVILKDRNTTEHVLQIRQGNCLVAVDGDRFVGIVLAGLIDPSKIEQHWIEVNERKPELLIEHIHYFLSDIERKARIFERYRVPNALYLSILAVDASVRRQGLGRRLVTALISLGRAKGLPLLVTTCTSLYSTRVMIALGMECVLSQAYADYKDQEGQEVFQPPAPHTNANVMAIQLL